MSVPELVRAAQRGDRAAVEQLVAEHLTLVYNVVGRALNGHADVDDVVQETFIQVMRDLHSLRDPQRFRAWLLAIAHRQVRVHLRARRRLAGRQRDSAADLPDPGSDFAARTVTEFMLTGQRRELVEAARWLDDDDRMLLALWWQETAGEITRAELAAALHVSTGHAAVRVKRMRDQLDAIRVVLRALQAGTCPELARTIASWPGRPDALWRKRLIRHTRGCPRCEPHRQGLIAPEHLLFGLAPVPIALAGVVHGLGMPPAKTAAALVPGKLTAAAVAALVAAGGAFSYAVTRDPETRPSPPSTTIVAAPDGTSAGDGTLDRPYTVARAVEVVRPGQTIALRGGTYRLTDPIVITTSGSARNRITLAGYQAERPVLDASALPDDKWAVTHEADFWTVRDLAVTGSLSHAYVCVSCAGTVFQRLALHGNVRGALTLRDPGTVANQVLDCDFFDNRGTGLGIKFGSGAGNLVRGNRAFRNGDNGFDFGDFASPVTLDTNWSFDNAINGFALGGGDPAPRAAHVLRNNAAWANAGHGFSDDENAAPIRLIGNTAWRNRVAGFSLPSGVAHLRGNVAAGNRTPVILTSRADAAGNTWHRGAIAPATVFRSTDPASAEGPRRPDGSLPVTSFLVSRSGSGATMRTP
ncbi:sigma-70 family RNA polymerase sigma factor [Actinoplanes sp. NBC_00393]|uniref:sigma-70 family RNA polymerase sigma factor n=1 Tax=Actinoplanes sp. NBC_00393 TaxID=2975953 RepID=UPI002E1D85F3